MINGTAHISSVPTHRVRPVADTGETGSEARKEQSRRALVPAGERRDHPRRSSKVEDRQLPQSARLGPVTLASLRVPTSRAGFAQTPANAIAISRLTPGRISPCVIPPTRQESRHEDFPASPLDHDHRSRTGAAGGIYPDLISTKKKTAPCRAAFPNSAI